MVGINIKTYFPTSSWNAAMRNRTWFASHWMELLECSKSCKSPPYTYRIKHQLKNRWTENWKFGGMFSLRKGVFLENPWIFLCQSEYMHHSFELFLLAPFFEREKRKKRIVMLRELSLVFLLTLLKELDLLNYVWSRSQRHLRRKDSSDFQLWKYDKARAKW